MPKLLKRRGQRKRSKAVEVRGHFTHSEDLIKMRVKKKKVAFGAV
jgi:hypothetical protein